jgi:hypothetical protein
MKQGNMIQRELWILQRSHQMDPRSPDSLNAHVPASISRVNGENSGKSLGRR